MIKKAALLPILAVLSACLLFRSRPPEYPDGLWFPLAGESHLTFEGEIIEALLLQENQVVFATREGQVCCLDPSAKHELWSFSMQEDGAGPLILGRDAFYAWDTAGNVYALDFAGELRWQTPLAESLTRGACEGNGSFYVVTAQGELVALNAATGHERWRYTAGDQILSDPICTGREVVFGCEDGFVYFLRPSGNLSGRLSVGDAVRSGFLLRGKRLYFGSENQHVYCVDPESRKLKWKVRTGGPVRCRPVTDGSRVYITSRNNVLYCLGGRSGTVLWWAHVPARGDFPPLVVQDKIAVASRSSRVVCFDTLSGEARGTYEAEWEARANPAWWDPYLLVAHYNRGTGKGRISFLEKEVKVTLGFSKASPQSPNEEIVISAEAVGFFQPQYEFYVTRYIPVVFGLQSTVPLKWGDGEQIAQPASEQKTWDWFPEESGLYLVRVLVRDARETAETEKIFRILSATADNAPSDPNKGGI
jgi:outer membrane protein assembly factor BamB